MAKSGVHVFVSTMAFLLLHFSFVILLLPLFFFYNILVRFWLWKDESNWNIRDISTIVRLCLNFVIFFQIYFVGFQWCVTILSFPIRHNIHAAWKCPYSEFFRKIQTRENSVFGHISLRDTVSKLYVNI